MAKSFTIITLAVGIACLNSLGWAQDFDEGKFEYQSSCASCHGQDGKGTGPVRSQLKIAPPDLTVLAKNNNGVFPVRSVYAVIDGRQATLVHGTRDMPIWGNRYIVGQVQKGEYSFYDAQNVVRTRILAIIDYLNRIQEK